MKKRRGRYQSYVRADGSKSYVVDMRDAEGKHIRRAFHTLEDADDFAEHMRRQRKRVRAGLERLVDPITVKLFANQWADARREAGKPISSSTVEKQQIRRYIVPKMGHFTLSRVTPAQWEAFLEHLITHFKLAPATRNNVRALLHKMYNDAIRKGHANRNPITEIPRLKVPTTGGMIWRTREECQRYLVAAAHYQSKWFYPMVCLAIQSGAREGELIALRWDLDVDLDQGLVYIWQTYEKESKSVVARTKGREPRWNGINDSVIQVLRQYRAESPKAMTKRGMLVFPRPDGRPQDPRRVRKIHDKVCARAGVSRIRFHDLRHQYATLYTQGKGNTKALQKLLGHSSSSMTDRYTHLDLEFLKQQASVVEFSPVSVINDGTNLPQPGGKLIVIKGDK